MPNVVVGRLIGNSLEVELQVAFDAQWSSFEIHAPELTPEADVLGYYTLVTSDFPNVDQSGFARKFISFGELRTNNAHGVYVRVMGVKPTGEKEALSSLTPVFIDRSNSVLVDKIISVLSYPSVAQIRLGFNPTTVRVSRLSGSAKIFYSYNGKDDHGEVTTAELVDEVASRDAALGDEIFLRSDSSLGSTARVRALRSDSIDRL